eukprot:10961516-Heterocapsa_arctica.AAC.1
MVQTKSVPSSVVVLETHARCPGTLQTTRYSSSSPLDASTKTKPPASDIKISSSFCGSPGVKPMQGSQRSAEGRTAPEAVGEVVAVCWLLLPAVGCCWLPLTAAVAAVAAAAAA